MVIVGTCFSPRSAPTPHPLQVNGECVENQAHMINGRKVVSALEEALW